MVEHTLQNGERILFVKVPEEASILKVFNDEDPYLSIFVFQETFRIYLPEGNWQLLGVSDELNEFKTIMQSLGLEGKYAILKQIK